MRIFFTVIVACLLLGILFFIPKSMGKLNSDFFNKIIENDFPVALEFENSTCLVEYTFDDDLEKFIRRTLRRNFPDYSAVVVINNLNGEVLSLVGGARGGEFDRLFPLSSNHPAASLIKVITSAALLDTGVVDTRTVFTYSGRGTTLYRRQINSTGKSLSLYNAFTRSNNAVFAGAAIKNLNPLSLYKMAERFLFNKSFSSDIEVETSLFLMPEEEFHMAELASGFNQSTLISPYHGAVIASIIANDGILKSPSTIRKVTCGEEVVWNSNLKISRAISKKMAKSLQEMMKGVLLVGGTARGAYKSRSAKKLLTQLDIGGKTGTMTGGNPYGKNDWFISFANIKGENTGISIAILNVDVDKWRVKAIDLTRMIMEYYFKDVL